MADLPKLVMRMGFSMGDVDRGLEAAAQKLSEFGQAAVGAMGGATKAAQETGNATQAAGGAASTAAAQLAEAESRKAAALAAASGAVREQTQDMAGLTAEQARQIAAGATYLKTLRQQVETLGMTQTQMLRHKASLLGVGDEAEPMIRKLDAAQKGLQQSTKQVGTSVGQTTQAMRMLPAQLSDVATQLAGGQNPLLVLMQQGLQTRDMFGGFREMFAGIAAALSPAVLGFGALAAAAGVMGLAVYQGHQEQKAFNDTLALTGNYAGLTADAFSASAQRIAKDAATGIGTGREALQALMATGTLTGAALDLLGAAAVRQAQLSGESMESIAKDYASMPDGVAKWAAEHNKSLHYMTLAQYDYIKELEDQGKTQAAVLENAKALHDHLATKGVESLGYLERAWRAVGRAISGAWDSAKSFGRDAPNAGAAVINDRRNELLRRAGAARGRGDTAQAKALEEQAAQVEASMQALQVEERRLAEEASRFQQKQQAAMKASDFIGNLEDGASKAARMNKELREYRQNLDAIRAVNPNDERLDPTRVSRMEADIRKKYAESGAAAKEALNAQIAVYEGYQQTLEEIKKGEERDLASQRKQGLISERDYLDQSYQLQDNYLVDRQALVELELEALGGKKQTAAYQKYVGELQKLQQERLNNEQTHVNAVAELQTRLATEYAHGIDQNVGSLQKSTDALRLENENYGMTKGQLASVTAERYEESLALLEQGRARVAMLDGTKAELDYYDEAIAGVSRLARAQREYADALQGNEYRDSVRKAAEESVKDWKRGSEEINRSLTDSLLRGFESGKGYARNLVDTMKNMFGTLVLRPIISAIVAPVGAMFSGGVLGVPGTAYASGGTSLLGAASNLQSAYSALTGGVGATVFGSSAAYAAAVPGLTSFGAGSQAAMLAAQTGEFGAAGLASTAAAGGAGTGTTGLIAAMGPAGAAAGGIVAGYGLGSMISGQFSAIGNNQAYATGGGTAAGAAIGTAILPGIGTAIGAIIGGVAGGLVNRAFGMGPKRYGDKGFEGVVTADGFDGRAFADWSQKGGWFRSNRSGTDYAAVDQKTLDGVNAQFGGMVGTYQALNKATGISGDMSGFRYTMRDDWSSPENIAKSFGKLSDALGDHLVPGIEGFRKEGEQLLDTATRLTGVFTATNQIAMVFGKDVQAVFGFVGLASTDMRQHLIDAAGGMDAFTSQLATYYETYYSEEEKLQRLRQTLWDQFAALGVAMPDSKEAFRAMVEGLNLTTDSGQQAYTALMAMAPSFAKLVDGLDQAKQAMSAFAQQVSDFQQSLMGGDLSTLTPEQKYAEAKRRYDETSAAAMSGDSAAQSQWTQIAQAFLEASRGYFASGGQYAADFASVQGFRPNGSHAGGLDYVPFDGYRAELHQGERVLTRAENARYSAPMPNWSQYGRGGNAALAEEVKALRAQVASLQDLQGRLAQAMEQSAQSRHDEAMVVQTKQVRLQKQLVDKQ
ncbi:phage tail length tape measure family protein [Cupriavidus pinatubonensis]|uniref:phage tail length tape measure family protein n=1 Tax=Cupriavidus pinatubonensis TaxID=248026 RepID=UPI001C7343EA|nr:phage tail length tape measure family protein [Cupriavidus pinatubonensis]QYY30304.1 phage tail length tape measure family protein [Cupriavidus pinatubonensis]